MKLPPFARCTSLLVVAPVVGCAGSAKSWNTQLSPEGPCWRVNLLDGIDEQDTTELHDLYDCLNQHDNLAPLGELDEVMEDPSRDGTPLGVELARVINRLPGAGVDVFGLAGAAVALLEANDPSIEPLLEVGVELLYGRSYDQVAVGVDLRAQSELDQGVVRPLIPVAGRVAEAILDDGSGVPETVASLLTSQALADVLCTSTAIWSSTDPSVQALASDLPSDVGQAVAATRTPDNDRWSEATGDSLGDLLRAVLLDTAGDGQTVVEAERDDLLSILGDPALPSRLEATLVQADDDGHLDPLGLQLLYLANVDVNGDELEPGEDSALETLARLLHEGDTSVSCSLDLWVTDLHVDLGNLSVELLRALASQDPNTVTNGVELLGQVLGSPLSQATLQAIADSGVCPAIDSQMVSDLGAIDRLNDPAVSHLLRVVLAVLSDFADANPDGDDHLEELVRLVDVAWSRGLLPPVEEVLRDLAGTPIDADVVSLLRLSLDTAVLDAATDDCPTGAQPVSFARAWGLLGAALGEADHQPLDQALSPVLNATLDQDGTWTAVGNLGALLRADGARIDDLPTLIARLISIDPDLALLREHARLIADPEIYAPLLRIVENRAFADALARAQLSEEGPLPFVARLVVDGTLKSLLWTIDLLLSTLDDGGSTARTLADRVHPHDSSIARSIPRPSP